MRKRRGGEWNGRVLNSSYISFLGVRAGTHSALGIQKMKSYEGDTLSEGLHFYFQYSKH